MTRPKICIVDCSTNETIEREMNDEEFAEFQAYAEAAKAQDEQIKAEIAVKLEAKASALAKLAALGLTEEEAKAIAG